MGKTNRLEFWYSSIPVTQITPSMDLYWSDGVRGNLKLSNDMLWIVNNSHRFRNIDCMDCDTEFISLHTRIWSDTLGLSLSHVLPRWSQSMRVFSTISVSNILGYTLWHFMTYRFYKGITLDSHVYEYPMFLTNSVSYTLRRNWLTGRYM